MWEIIVAVLAGLLAGFSTGFAGLSAAVFISPMLVSFLKVDSFSAIGIALASDVLASGVSSITYAKHKNIDIKKGFVLLVTVLVFAIIGTIVSHFFTSLSVGEGVMGFWVIIASILMGLKFLIKPGNDLREKKFPVPDAVIAVVSGIYIGFVCGFQGTGGGLMMLFVLNILLGFEFKKAVGTSVLVMTFTALIGAISHFAMRGIPDIKLLVICVVSTLVGSQIASIIANKIKSVYLKRATGVMLLLSGIASLAAKFIG